MAMQRRALRWIRIEIGVSVVAGILATMTLIRPDWIEVLFGLELDNGTGALEGLLTAIAIVIAIAAGIAAIATWRRAQLARDSA